MFHVDAPPPVLVQCAFIRRHDNNITGKMLLDEKEADAEAHEGEKEALWRRIQVRVLNVMFCLLVLNITMCISVFS